MADKFQFLLKQQELLINGKDVDQFAKPYQKNYEEIKEENRRFKQIKRYQNMLKLHSLMPKMLRKGGESEKATITLHQIDVDKRVQKVLTDFKNESRQSKIERVRQYRSIKQDPTCKANSTEQVAKRFVVHDHDHQAIVKYSNHKRLYGSSYVNRVAQSLKVNDDLFSSDNNEPFNSPKIKVNKNLKGATVQFDSFVTNQIEEITRYPNQKELIVKALQTSFDRRRREELSGNNKSKKQTAKQVNQMKNLEKENQASRDEKKQSNSSNTVDNNTITTNSRKPHDKAILVWSKKSTGAFVHNHFVKQKYEDLPIEVRNSLEKSQQQSQTTQMNRFKTLDQTRNSQGLNVNVNFNKKNRSKTKQIGHSVDFLSNPMNTEKVSPRLMSKDPVQIDIQQSRAQVKRPESAASFKVNFTGNQPAYFNIPKTTIATDYQLTLEQRQQSNASQMIQHPPEKYRLSQRLTQSVDRLVKPIGSTVRLKSAFNKARSSLKVQDSELKSVKGSLMQSLDGQRIPVKKTTTNHLVLRKQFVYNDPQYYKVKFAQPALFKTGCLTCGRENVSVQNYGERYVCTTCQKSLQTPTGESVTLKPSTDSRKIVAQCWKNNVMLKGIKANIDNLRIFGFKCHATFAGEKGELIVLLDEV